MIKTLSYTFSIVAALVFMQCGVILYAIAPLFQRVFSDKNMVLPSLTRQVIEAGHLFGGVSIAIICILFLGKDFVIKNDHVRFWINLPGVVIALAINLMVLVAVYLPFGQLMQVIN